MPEKKSAIVRKVAGSAMKKHAKKALKEAEKKHNLLSKGCFKALR